MSSSEKGIKMGTDVAMDSAVYNNPNKYDKNVYSRDIDPNSDSDNDDEDAHIQQIQMNRRHKLKDTNDDGEYHMPDVHDSNMTNRNFDPLSQKHKQIQSKMNDYQQQQFSRMLTPARRDPFATPNIQSQTSTHKQKINPSKSALAAMVGQETGRSYREVMQSRQIARHTQESIDVLTGKSKKLLDTQETDPLIVVKHKEENSNKTKKNESVRKRNRNTAVCTLFSYHFSVLSPYI